MHERRPQSLTPFFNPMLQTMAKTSPAAKARLIVGSGYVCRVDRALLNERLNAAGDCVKEEPQDGPADEVEAARALASHTL